jgi:hypothetical protein
MKREITGLMGGLLYASLALVDPFHGASAQQPVAVADSADAGWPRAFTSGATTFSVYQPQIESWAGNRLAARAAVAVRDTGAAEPTYGVIWLSSRTDVDKTSRLVSLEGLTITRASFPSAPGSQGGWQASLQRLLPEACKTIALDRLESELAVQQQVAKGSAQALRNTPPRVLFSTQPAILVLIDGAPVLRPAGSGLQRVINTRPLLLEDQGRFYLHVFDGWMQAAALTGPWSVAASPPAALAAAMQSAVADNQVDLLDAASADSTAPAPSLADGPAPAIYVSTEPAELIVTDGAPDYVPVDGTQLLYVENTTGRLFKSIADNDTYVLISGRWYRAPSTQGPWAYVPGRSLPADFARIPDSSVMENVKASVPGTRQAQEAAIANAIPQTATVERTGTTMDPAPTIDGDPQYRPIEGTDLRYVLNASTPIIEIGPNAFYAVQNGVWFDAGAPAGPWVVAATVPAEIYAIPPSSPLYYVTFVQVYGATPDVVYVGYTPGYYGTVLDPDGLVVYGTGYAYSPWIGADWFGYPCTYGFGAGVRWTPWTGWGFGFGFGWSWGRGIGMAWGGWGWGAHPWWGPSAWWWAPRFHGYARTGPWRGRGGWGGTTADVYARWDRSHVVNRAPLRAEAWTGGLGRNGVGIAYNSHTGIPGIRQRAPMRSVYAYDHPALERGGESSGQYGGRVGGNEAASGRRTNVVAQRPVPAPRAPAPRPGIPPAARPAAIAPAARPAAIAPAARPAVIAPATRPAMIAPASHMGTSGPGAGDLYAGPRGEVYRRSPAGGWEQHGGASWQPAAAAPALDREFQARSMGEARSQGFQSAGDARGGSRGGQGRGGGRR